jgi:hypothetical protein
MHEDQFTATGPAFEGAGFSKAAFSTNREGTDSTYGVNVQGEVCGVYGESGRLGNSSRTAPLDNDEDVGVCGLGRTYGVIGKGFLKAGVYGESDSLGGGVIGQGKGNNALGVAGIHKAKDENSKPTDNGSGIIGVSEAGEGFGVVGLSVRTLRDPFLTDIGPADVPRPFRDAQGKLVTQADGGGTGVLGGSRFGVGVKGMSDRDDGVVGISGGERKSGVFGDHTEKTGVVFGVSGRTLSRDGAGVQGFSDQGIGVRGDSVTNDGIRGTSRFKDKSGVFGRHLESAEAGFGVSGFSDSPEGAGVNGFSAGYGGHFSGDRAPLRLKPAATLGHPTTGIHQKGELYVDGNGDLFFCKVDGTPGTWFRVRLDPA